MLFLAGLRRIRLLECLLFSSMVAVGLIGGLAPTAVAADPTAATFVANASLGLDGKLRVHQVVTYTGQPPESVHQVFETKRDVLGDRRYVYDISGFTAMAGGQPVTPTVQPDGDRFVNVDIPSNGQRRVSLDYVVTGAVVTTLDGTALEWPLLQGLASPVAEFEGTVAVPAPISYVACTSGLPNSQTPCRLAAGGTDEAQQPTFADGPRAAGEFVQVQVGFPPQTVASNEQLEHYWTASRAFSISPMPVIAALTVLVLGAAGLVLLRRRGSRDSAGGAPVHRVAEFVAGPEGVEFRLTGELRPGQIGTVADDRVDPIDVTATLLDLAVRGYLLITELPRQSPYAPTDWELSRGPAGAESVAELKPFEQALLAAVLGEAVLDDEGGPVLVSALPDRVAAGIGEVQDRLYSEVVAEGWFARRPDSTRNRWTSAGIGALIGSVAVTVVLVMFTAYGLLGLVLIALAVGLLAVAQEMPVRTAAGASLLAGLNQLRADLHTQSVTELPYGQELVQVSALLPYAVVLGGHQRWLDAAAHADYDEADDRYDLGWYHGPEGWQLHDLPDSLRNFITTVTGELFAR